MKTLRDSIIVMMQSFIFNKLKLSKEKNIIFSVNRLYAPKIQIDIEQRYMDCKTLSADISPVPKNVRVQLDESVDVLFVLFDVACEKFNKPYHDKLDILTYAFTGAARNHFWETSVNENCSLGHS